MEAILDNYKTVHFNIFLNKNKLFTSPIVKKVLNNPPQKNRCKAGAICQ
jgi:hypothetical protein